MVPEGGAVKRKMQRRVTYVLAATVLIFAIVYVPGEVTDPLAVSLATWQQVLARSGISLPVLALLGWLIFSQDHLATGGSRASRFFRHYYPSQYAQEKYGLSKERANRLWFDYFNGWATSEDQRLREDYARSFQRTYSVRLIFYLKRILFGFVILAAIATPVFTWLIPTDGAQKLLPGRIAIILAAMLLLVWLHMSSRFSERSGTQSYGERYQATGVYAMWKEIGGILTTRFEDDVLLGLGDK
jgi:hypothetical protein